MRISSSQAAATMRLSKYKTQQRLQAELLGTADPEAPPDPRDVNHPFIFGHLLEGAVVEAGRLMLEQWLIDRQEADALPVVAEHLGGETGRDTRWNHSVLPMTGAPDAIYRDARGRVYLVDAKTTQLWHLYNPDQEDVPADVYCQGLHMWELAREIYGEGLEPIVVIPYLKRGSRSDPLSMVVFPVSLEMLGQLISAEQRFIEMYCTPGEDGALAVPAPETVAEVLEDTVLEAEEIAYLDDHEAGRIEAFLEERRLAKQYQDRADAGRIEVIQLFGVCGLAKSIGGRPLAKLAIQATMRIDVDRFREEEPELAEKYTKTTRSFVIRAWDGSVKKAKAKTPRVVLTPEGGDSE